MSHFLIHTQVHRGAFQKQGKKGQKITSVVQEKDSSHQGGTLPTLSTVRGIGINERHGENGMRRHGGSCDVMFVINYLSGGDWHGLTSLQSFGKKFSLVLPSQQDRRRIHLTNVYQSICHIHVALSKRNAPFCIWYYNYGGIGEMTF